MKSPTRDPKPLRLPTDPKTLIWVGVVMLVLGVALPLLMVAKLIPSTYFLTFISYAFQLVGMVASTIGIFSIVKVKRDTLKAQDRNNIFHEPPHPDEE
ncbi:MAG: hypothetical protein GX603_03905 [Chloroflexi bacterium]|nr:hypothetical protein [Chloroflexota bacterium]